MHVTVSPITDRKLGARCLAEFNKPQESYTCTPSDYVPPLDPSNWLGLKKRHRLALVLPGGVPDRPFLSSYWPQRVTLAPAIDGKWHASADICGQGKIGRAYTWRPLSGQELDTWLESKGLTKAVRQSYITRYLPDIERSYNPFAGKVCQLPRVHIKRVMPERQLEESLVAFLEEHRFRPRRQVKTRRGLPT